jgi:hypothetical protein
MPLDPSIALQAKGVTLQDPLQQAGNFLQLQGAQQSLQTNALAYEQAQAAAGERNALRDYFADPKNAGKDAASVQADILSRAPTTGGAVLKSIADNRKLNVETDNAQQTNAAGQAKDIAETVAAAKTPQDLIKLGYLGVAQGRWKADKFDPVVQHLLSGAANTPEAFAAFKDQLGKAIMSPDALAAQNVAKPTAVETGGTTRFVDTNPVTNPGIVGSSFAQNPKILNNEQGSFVQAPDGSSMSPIPAGTRMAGPSDAAGYAPPRSAATQAEMDAIYRESTGKDPRTGTSAGGYPTTVPANMVAANARPLGAKDYDAPEAAKNAGKYEADLNESVQSGRNLMALNGEFQQALQNYQAGPGAPTRLAIAKTLAGLGVSKDIVEKINRGSIADAQEIQKLGAQGAMQALKTSMDGQGRISQAEFQIFKQNNPSIELDPNAIQKIQAFQAQQYQKTFAEQQSLADYKSKGGNLSMWPAVWSKMLDQGGQSQPATRSDAMGTPGAAFQPPVPKVPAEVRIAPDGRKVGRFADGSFGYIQ